ncbi:MAG TPA: hypothetical protein VJH03_12255 [Blastocatellia bacterium]|nr:hypothetical protein [Blastocatellia bacterium]
MKECDAPRLGLASDLVKCLLVTLFDLLFDHLPPRPVVLAVECRRDCDAEVLYQLADIPSQRGGVTPRQSQITWLGRLVKIVDVTPVGRRRLGCRFLLEEPANQAVPSHARRAKDVEVVALSPNADAELDRLDCPRLADDLTRVRKLSGRFKCELGGIASPVERPGIQRFEMFHHSDFRLTCDPTFVSRAALPCSVPGSVPVRLSNVYAN